MNADLYFIALLLRAYEATDRVAPIQRAFETIQRLGRQSEYARGYFQFLRFIKLVREARQARCDESPMNEDELTFDRGLMQELLDWTEDEGIRESLQRAFAVDEYGEGQTSHLRIILIRNEEWTMEWHVTVTCPRVNVDNLTPGKYKLVLSTGRVVWEQDLTSEHLVLAYAFPDEAMSFAADSGGRKDRPTITASALDGDLLVRIYPGLRSGRMEISLCTK